MVSPGCQSPGPITESHGRSESSHCLPFTSRCPDARESSTRGLSLFINLRTQISGLGGTAGRSCTRGTNSEPDAPRSARELSGAEAQKLCPSPGAGPITEEMAPRLIRPGSRAVSTRRKRLMLPGGGRGVRRDVGAAGGAGDTAGGRRQDGEADGGADRAGGAIHQRRAGPRAGLAR